MQRSDVNVSAILVQRRNGESDEWHEIATLPENERQYVDHAGIHGTWRSYRVRAVNKAGLSAYSNIAKVAGESK